MKPVEVSEKRRLEVLWSYEILDTPAEQQFDAITRLAACVCETPVALISLVDENRQWFKSSIGMPVTETPRDISFCGHAIEGQDLMVVPDATADPRFEGNPLVVSEPRVQFYAGMPLVTSEGVAIGTLCVLDHRPRADGSALDTQGAYRALRSEGGLFGPTGFALVGTGGYSGP